LYFLVDGPEGNTLAARINNTSGSGFQTMAAPNAIVLDTWQHVALTYDDAGDRKLHMYINGVETAYAASPALTGTLLTSSNTLVVGNRISGNRAFQGMLDEVYIYSRALSAEEIKILAGSSLGNLDVTPPAISIAFPTDGSVVSGTFTVSGNASDDVGVSAVQVAVDGGQYQTTFGTAIWSFNLNTFALTDGLHAITAEAIDSSGNSVTASITVTVNNGITPSAGTCNANPTSVNFGSVLLGSSSTQSVTLSNTGSADVTLSQANVSGTGFSMGALLLPLMLRPGQSTSFAVNFAPTAAGSAIGNISITSNASNSPTSISLSGSGLVVPHTVDLTWNVSTSVVQGYRVYRGSSLGGPYTRLNSSLIASATYSDTTVQGGRTYYYVVTAVDANGTESAFSNEAAAVIP
jgi:hypothetical protein